MLQNPFRLLQSYFSRTSENKAYLLKGSAGALAAQLVGLAAGFVTSWVLARLLGVAQYGVYTYLFSWLTVLSTLSAAGIEQFLVKQTAACRSAGRTDLLKGAQHYAYGVLSILSVLVSGGGMLWIYACNNGFITHVPDLLRTEENRRLLGWVLLAIPITTLAKIPEGMLRGGKHIISSQLPENVVKPLLLLLLMAVLYMLWGGRVTLAWAVWLNLLTIAFALFLYVVLYWRKFGNTPSVPARYEPALWWRSMVSFFFISLLAIINNRADVLILGSLATDADVGIYNVAARLADVPKMLLMAANLALAPLFADLYARRQMQQLQSLLTRSVRLITAAGLLPVLLLVLAGKPVLAIWGHEFVAGHWALTVMCLAQLFNLACGSVGVLLMMTGHEKWVSYGLALGTLVNMALNFALIPVWGINGAGMASAFTVVVWNVFLTRMVFVKLQLNPTVARWG
ncbi:hypothetical protein C7N43_29770 [Sphingobacteriales bacterium UPWRP_1]|nr:hypothetical protein B6N25_02175 [Sphingobacteriales bacterium TSM_CSS]PSJ73324.1 hypothetical protein C7N43_29770 [Sphingobacteriales bacterium UPWRP_1]